jgi:hypothetical protein
LRTELRDLVSEFDLEPGSDNEPVVLPAPPQPEPDGRSA